MDGNKKLNALEDLKKEEKLKRLKLFLSRLEKIINDLEEFKQKNGKLIKENEALNSTIRDQKFQIDQERK